MKEIKKTKVNINGLKKHTKNSTLVLGKKYLNNKPYTQNIFI